MAVDPVGVSRIAVRGTYVNKRAVNATGVNKREQRRRNKTPTRQYSGSYSDYPQSRTGYCAIWTNAKAAGNPVQQTGGPCA
jgi:hypothetical protein